MRCATRPKIVRRSHGRPGQVVWLLLAACAGSGCGEHPKTAVTRVSDPASVRLINPPKRKIVRVVEQPSFVESYERTSVYPKMTGYIEKWIVDIGDRVKKGDVLCTLFVPEIVEDYKTKLATVELEKEQIALAQKTVQVAEADVEDARAKLAEAKAILAKYQAEMDRWDTEVKRLQREVERNVVAPQILLESTNQLRSSTAARDAAQASISAAQAALLSREAALAKAKVAVDVARAHLAVAESDASRLKAWVGYLTLTAPYDGVIVARNANTFDFVLPATGDPTANMRSPDISSSKAAPIYVVDRLDEVRVFVDIPELDANYVQKGSKATVLIDAYGPDEIPATVTRTSWALNVTSRTLRAEIDLPNTDSRILPGMYAYGKVIIERPNVRALPVDAIVYSGDQRFCWFYQNGHAVRGEVKTGVTDDTWIEVASYRIKPSQSGARDQAPWTAFKGSEKVILGDLSILYEDAPVRVTGEGEPSKIAHANP